MPKQLEFNFDYEEHRLFHTVTDLSKVRELFTSGTAFFEYEPVYINSLEYTGSTTFKMTDDTITMHFTFGRGLHQVELNETQHNNFLDAFRFYN